MKIFVFTYDRFSTITTSLYFEGLAHSVLCHTDDQMARFAESGRIASSGTIIPTGNPRGLAYNRNYALDQMEPGEWALFMVDDLIEMSALPYKYHEPELGITTKNQKEWRERFKSPITASEFMTHCINTAAHCEEKGYALGGFSLTDNPLFRTKQYQYHSLADGRAWVVKKTHLRFDLNAQLIDDTCFTAMNLKAFGGVVVNNFVLPLCDRYTPGAFGTIEQRIEQKKAECKYLVETYPDFIAFAEKKGWPTGSHVKIRQKKTNHMQKSLF